MMYINKIVIELEDTIAQILGWKQGYFSFRDYVNQTAIKLHTNPGEQIIADKYAHVYYEGGGVFNSGVSFLARW
jgi:threonine aldolase